LDIINKFHKNKDFYENKRLKIEEKAKNKFDWENLVFEICREGLK
jgi:hypothetical protein